MIGVPGVTVVDGGPTTGGGGGGAEAFLPFRVRSTAAAATPPATTRTVINVPYVLPGAAVEFGKPAFGAGARDGNTARIEGPTNESFESWEFCARTGATLSATTKIQT
jgi:hypothetical protein